MPYNHNNIRDRECQDRLCEKKRKYKEVSSVNPEKEPFLQVSLEFMCALSQVHFKGHRTKDLVWWIARKTWGWNKSNDMISAKQFAEALNYKKANGKDSIENAIRRFIDEAVEMNIIWREYGGSEANWYRVNKYYDTWNCDINKEIIDKEMAREIDEAESKDAENIAVDTTAEPEMQPEMQPETVDAEPTLTEELERDAAIKEVNELERRVKPADWVDVDYGMPSFQVKELEIKYKANMDAITMWLNSKRVLKEDGHGFAIRYYTLKRKLYSREIMDKGCPLGGILKQ